MFLTVCLSLVMMAGAFLLLYSGVALIQDKRLFTSAPREVYEVIRPKEERFPGAHLLGWQLSLLSVLIIFYPLYYGAVDGIRQGYVFGQFLVRFLIMFLGVKAFDILFFDYCLLCHSSFYSHFYPETAPVLGPHLFGFNKRGHLIQILILTVISILLAWICSGIV